METNRLRPCLPLLVALFGFACYAHAWSEQGHRIVALAAQEHLSENSKRRMSYLLGKEAVLVDVATWADELSRERPETEAWHSITIPPDADSVDLERDCPVGDCVTAKIRECIGIVRLAIRSKNEIVDAFKMLVGLSADMHQPLLNGYPPSHGKEDRVVVLDGEEMPLFDVWESRLLGRFGSEEEVLELVQKRIAEADYDEWTSGTLRSWTWETHRVAVEKVYPTIKESEKTVLAAAELEAASEIVVEQLAKSAVRLVHMLALAWP